MGPFVFLSLDGGDEPEWQVRVDAIVAFRSDGDGVDVVLSSGATVWSPLTVPALMAKMQAAISRCDGA